MGVRMTGTSCPPGFFMKEKYFIAIWNHQRHIFVCILVSQTPNQNGMKRQGKPLPSWAQICQVSAWEKFVAWSYKPLKIGVYNGSAILTLSVVALLLCYNISSPSICEIVICPMAGNWGDDETPGYALNYLNLSVLGFYWHIKRDGEQGARGWCQTAECLRCAREKGKQGTRWLSASVTRLSFYTSIFFSFSAANMEQNCSWCLKVSSIIFVFQPSEPKSKPV